MHTCAAQNTPYTKAQLCNFIPAAAGAIPVAAAAGAGVVVVAVAAGLFADGTTGEEANREKITINANLLAQNKR